MINLKELSLVSSFLTTTDRLMNVDLILATDNRLLTDENIFIAIVGERFNPLEHLDKVLETGCKFVVYEKNIKSEKLIQKYIKDLVFIQVSSIETFIQEAGKLVASKFKSRGGVIIGISGSNGKTTTKEMLYHILDESEESKINHVICTQKNYNNHLGVPFTLFQIGENTKYAIVELGSNHPGEIKVLCEIIKPQFGITTNIGDTHLEFFGNRENVFKEESVLHNYVTKKFFVNLDDEFLSTLAGDKKYHSYGKNSKDTKLTFGNNNVSVSGQKITNMNITGEHNFYNLAVAFLIATELKPADENIKDYAESFKPTSNRSEWIDYKNQKIYLDAYNANPSSMKSSIDGFAQHLGSIGANQKDSCLILGDMNELGPDAARFHKETAQLLNDYSFGSVVFVGRHSSDYRSGFSSNCSEFDSSQALLESYEECVAKYKFVFIKGSRSLQLETILDIK